jgi:hypothetical protein
VVKSFRRHEWGKIISLDIHSCSVCHTYKKCVHNQRSNTTGPIAENSNSSRVSTSRIEEIEGQKRFFNFDFLGDFL